MDKLLEKGDLEKRTADFGGEIIAFAKNIKRDVITNPLINQIVRSATSVGANYCEATGASSRKDFKNKIYICKKECKETKFWLEMMAKSSPDQKERCRRLWKEAHELTLIFSKTILTLERKK
jgi:four helix bundle protein